MTAQAYLRAMQAGDVRGRLRETLAGADVSDPTVLAETAARLQALVRSAGMPDDLRRAVVDAYDQLGDDVAVAVRSSATSEDTAGRRSLG